MIATISRERITATLASGPDHLRPLLFAVRDHGCAMATVLPDAGAFTIPTDQPVIMVVLDDLQEARWPAAFDRQSLVAFLRACGGAVIVAGAPELHAYASAASVAVLSRRNVVLIETRVEQEIVWTKFVREAEPRLELVIVSPVVGRA